MSHPDREKAMVYRDIPRVDAKRIASLQGLTVADLHDALPPAARAAGLLDQSMRAMTPGLRVVGQAVTAFCAPNDSLMTHCALYLAQRGDVLVISNGGVRFGALWGGNVAFDAQAAGLGGAVVEAPVRDLGFIRELKFPVWANSVSVTRSEKNGAGCVNRPISCGGCVINPGDIVVADDDGVLCFSPVHIEALVDQVSKRVRLESELREKLSAGVRLFETQNFGALLQQKGIEIKDGCWNESLSCDKP